MMINRRSLMAGAAGLLVPAPMAALAAPNEIVGAGGSTIRPVMQGWIEGGTKALNIKITYDAIGSPNGISRILAGITDFAILELPLTDQQLEQASLYQFPLAFGAYVFVVNVPGVESHQLSLTGQDLGGIYSGAIKNWNDPRIKASNPGVSLPDLEIKPMIHQELRGPMLGSSVVVTAYLMAANADWRQRFGDKVPARWGVGSMAATGETMTETLRAVPGSIGYLPLGAAERAKLSIVAKRDNNGKVVKAGEASLQAAIAAIDMTKMPLRTADLPGENVWPAIIASYGVVPRNLKAKDNGAAIHGFFKYILTDGAEVSRKRGAEPMTQEQRGRVLAQLDKFLA